MFQRSIYGGRFAVGHNLDLAGTLVAGGEHERHANAALGKTIHVKTESSETAESGMHVVPVYCLRGRGRMVCLLDTKCCGTGKNQRSFGRSQKRVGRLQANRRPWRCVRTSCRKRCGDRHARRGLGWGRGLPGARDWLAAVDRHGVAWILHRERR
jgi:hypothetical protein